MARYYKIVGWEVDEDGQGNSVKMVADLAKVYPSRLDKLTDVRLGRAVREMLALPHCTYVDVRLIEETESGEPWSYPSVPTPTAVRGRPPLWSSLTPVRSVTWWWSARPRRGVATGATPWRQAAN